LLHLDDLHRGDYLANMDLSQAVFKW
jgi:hypothetical protein